MTVVLRPTITVQTSAYADGDAVGSLFTLEKIAVRNEGSGFLSRFTLRSKTNISVQTFVHLFDQNPSATTVTDNGALTINSADHSKILKTFTIAAADWVSPKGAAPWYTAELVDPINGKPFVPFDIPDTVDGRNMYFIIEADGAITFSATTDLAAIVGAEAH